MVDLKTILCDKRTISVLIVAVIAVSILAVFVSLNDGSLDFRGREVRVIITDSMDGEPRTEYDIETIPVDSLVMVRFLSDSEKEDIKVGDVVQFRQGSILNHHRVIENNVEGGYVITQGDNVDTPDGHISYDRVRGEVVGVNHALGEIFLFVKAYVFVILIGLVVIYMASKLVEEIRKEKKEGGN